jgi:hypothetical protein
LGRGASFVFAFTVLSVLAAALSAAPAFAGAIHTYSGISFGNDGTSTTSFENPSTVAVDQESHIVYVGDSQVRAIYKFNENGEAVDFSGSAPYIEGNKITDVPLPSGTGESQVAVDPHNGTIYANFGRQQLVAYQPSGEPALFTEGPGAGTNRIPGFEELLGVVVDQDGNIYAGDYTKGVVDIFTPGGAPLTSFPTSQSGNVAVDSNGSVYVAHWHSSVEKFIPSVFPVTAATEYSSTGTVDPNTTLSVAVDPASNDLYASDGAQVTQYDKTGVRLGSLAGPGEPGSLVAPEGVAIDGTSGRTFVSDSAGEKQVAIFGPSIIVPATTAGEASDIGKTSATIEGTVDPDGVALTDCHFEYVTVQAFAATGFADLGSGGSAPCSPDFASIPADSVPHSVSANLEGLAIGTDYRYRLLAANADGTGHSESKAFKTLSTPTISGELVLNAQFSEASLEVKINPEGFATTYLIEYGPNTAYGQSTAVGAVGSDKADHTVTAALSGLEAGTTYHWRAIATNAIGTTTGADQIFDTHGRTVFNEACPNQVFRSGVSARLPDCRAYELVSPVAKNNTDIYAPPNLHSNLVRLDQAAGNGEKLTYTTVAGFGDTVGAPYTSQYIASRGAEGWSSHSITPPQGVSPIEAGARIDLEFRAFTADLCDAAMRHNTAEVLAPGAIEDFFNIYRRQNCGEEGYEAVTTSEPPNVPNAIYQPNIQGLSSDGRCTVFYVNDQLTPDASPAIPANRGETYEQLYESCGGHLRLVSVLPNGEANPIAASAGSRNFEEGGLVELRRSTDARAVSSNGSRIYWTSFSDADGFGKVYLRENAEQPQSAVSSSECTEADKACTIAVSSGDEAHYWSASPDGSEAFFSEGNPDLGGVELGEMVLYEFDLASKSSAPIASEILGIVGASEDASRISFASKEVLTTALNAEGKSPVAGKANLYLFDSTKSGSDRFRFIGTLAIDDTRLERGISGDGSSFPLSPISPMPYRKTSRVSPDGRQVVFASVASLTGYDNTDVDSGEADAEIFLYDASANGGEGRLRCVSCNPSGQRPQGRDIEIEGIATKSRAAALLPLATTELYASHVVSDDGSRVFFNSYDELVPADSNGKVDVYQWEAPGAGDCTEASPSYKPLNEGCLNLISSGESPADSEFLDASADGRDVFFTTGSSLLPQDPGLVDIYDARAGGGYPPPPHLAAACEGEACQGPPAPPNDPTPASSSFEGAGNVKAAKKHQAKKKKHRKKAHHKAKKAHRANDNRRTAR